MTTKFWTHLKLKNGDQVKFVPPAPDGERLGGITQTERQMIGDVNRDLELVKDELVGVTDAANALSEVIG